jgi:hypothetical protein
VLVAGLAGSQAAAATTDKIWRFKVYLADKEIGNHIFHVKETPNNSYIAITADFDVNILFINAYSYDHSNYEVWRNGCLVTVHSRTNDNGEELYVKGEKSGMYFTIESNNQTIKETGCIKSFAYWDPSFLMSQRLLNAQTGELMRVESDYLGIEKITIRSKPTLAKHYRLHTDKFSIDLWYSENDEWLALNSTTSNGSVLRYVIQ